MREKITAIATPTETIFQIYGDIAAESSAPSPRR